MIVVIIVLLLLIVLVVVVVLILIAGILVVVILLIVVIVLLVVALVVVAVLMVILLIVVVVLSIVPIVVVLLIVLPIVAVLIVVLIGGSLVHRGQPGVRLRLIHRRHSGGLLGFRRGTLLLGRWEPRLRRWRLGPHRRWWHLLLLHRLCNDRFDLRAKSARLSYVVVRT